MTTGYGEDIISLIKDAIHALDDTIRFNIMQELMTHDKVTPTQLIHKLHLDDNKLQDHIEILSMAGLLDQYAIPIIADDKSDVAFVNPTFKVSPIGKDLMMNLLKTFEI